MVHACNERHLTCDIQRKGRTGLRGRGKGEKCKKHGGPLYRADIDLNLECRFWERGSAELLWFKIITVLFSGWSL